MMLTSFLSIMLKPAILAFIMFLKVECVKLIETPSIAGSVEIIIYDVTGIADILFL